MTIHLGLNDEEQAMLEITERFSREKLAPHYQEREKAETLDRALIEEMGSMGLIGPDIPEEFGGLGQSALMAGLINETVSYGDFNMSYITLLGSLMGQIVARNAPDGLAKEWLPQMLSGKKLVALGLTEPRGGSDAANLILKAEKVGDQYILNGEKTSMSFSTEADAAIVWARTGTKEDGAKGVSAFLVDFSEPGVTRTKFNDLGTKPVARGSAFFDNVKVPASHLLGEEGTGFTQVMQGFDYSRILIALECLGAAQASVDETWEYVQEREAFGDPLVRYQGVSFPLAEADTKIEMAKQLCYHALKLKDAGLPFTSESAMVKWFAPKTSVEIIHQCLLLHGHYGYTMDLPHQQRMRDVMGLEIGDGTSQIMKLIIAREKVGRVAVQYQPYKKSMSKGGA